MIDSKKKSRSLSSAWDAAFPAEPTRRWNTGICCQRVGTPYPLSLPNVGMQHAILTKVPRLPARCMFGKLAFWIYPLTILTPVFLASRRKRPKPLTPSSGCSWRWPGKRLRTPASILSRYRGAAPVSLSAYQVTIMTAPISVPETYP